MITKHGKQLSRRNLPGSPFAFSKLPPELQSLVIAELVVGPSMVPLRRLSSWNGCCGHCRGSIIDDKTTCLCANTKSYSTSCRCVSIFDGIFLASKPIRAEALRLYWSQNTIVHRGMLCTIRVPGHFLTRVPTAFFNMIRHLAIDTPCCIRGHEIRSKNLLGYSDWNRTTYFAPCEGAWKRFLTFLEKKQGEQLQVEIRTPPFKALWNKITNEADSENPPTLLMDYEIKETTFEKESARFEHLVQRFMVRVKVLLSEPDGKSTILIDHNPFLTKGQRIRALIPDNKLPESSTSPGQEIGELSRKRKNQEID